ncbi:MAG: hypothetical protein AVDCRST_MAG43-171 [uncultured Thermomicrobiales bacterium]|uniref:Uncharacterized protein n=1 Tax=uncultured Thermomicrobiales bacterium TaxID=1645740 RepID=A0A6J4U5K4_9BACT|nr:MAG: hypothetical protein AVDCRST_MAG43-171 [uncultured Thermomicrobiales bacterium]
MHASPLSTDVTDYRLSSRRRQGFDRLPLWCMSMFLTWSVTGQHQPSLDCICAIEPWPASGLLSFGLNSQSLF